MKVGGFFVLLVRHPKHQLEERKTKVKTLIALTLFATSIIEALANACEGILSKGWYLRGIPLAQQSQQHKHTTTGLPVAM
jgi:hypothetical protein